MARTGCCTLFLLVVSSAGVPLMMSEQTTNQTSIKSTNHTSEDTRNQTTEHPILTMDEQIANARMVTRDKEKDENVEVNDLDMLLTPEQETAYQPLMTSDQKTNQTSVQKTSQTLKQTTSQTSIQSTNHTSEETTKQTTEQPIMTMDEQIANARMVTIDKEKSEDKNLEVHDLDMMLTAEQETAYQLAPTKANTTAPQK